MKRRIYVYDEPEQKKVHQGDVSIYVKIADFIFLRHKYMEQEGETITTYGYKPLLLAFELSGVSRSEIIIIIKLNLSSSSCGRDFSVKRRMRTGSTPQQGAEDNTYTRNGGRDRRMVKIP
jgi:hypothetical protein